ncbi:MAG: sulfotransferase family protein [Pseudobdellovibrio sp.]
MPPNGIDNPIFIIGTERSGSNLMRMILNSHPHIAIPHPPHIMRDMTPLLGSYGDLRDDFHFKELICDIALLVQLHFSPWPIAIDQELVFKSSPSRTLYGIYAAIYEQYLKHTGKARWGCKSTFMFQHIETILHHHARAKFIHLVRDPRDVAVSASDSIFSNYHPYKMAELWAQEQSVIEQSAERLASENRLVTVKYEDLVKAPEEQVKKIMSFLDEHYVSEQLNFFKTKEADQLAALSKSWKQVSSPISDKSVAQYKRKLSPEGIAFVESTAGDLMKRYGYHLETSGDLSPSSAQLQMIEISEQISTIKTEFKSMFSDKNFFMRWKKKIYLRNLKNKKRSWS